MMEVSQEAENNHINLKMLCNFLDTRAHKSILFTPSSNRMFFFIEKPIFYNYEPTFFYD